MVGVGSGLRAAAPFGGLHLSDDLIEGGRALRRLRLGMGMSQRQLVSFLGLMDTRNVRAWEAGEKGVPQSVWMVLELIYRFPEVQRFYNIEVNPNWREINLDDPEGGSG